MIKLFFRTPSTSADRCLVAVEFGSKKAGYNIDRQTEEKYTDSGREAFEKYTGYAI
jgi:hypothetical protein